MRNEYAITFKTNLVLYGAATMGMLTFRYLESVGYNIIAFIDKRAKEISEICGIPVYAPNSNFLLEGNKECVIIITVKNVFSHEEIFDYLYELGYRKIIFKSYWELLGVGNETSRYLGDLFDNIVSKHILDGMDKVPYADGCTEFIEHDFALIEEKNHMCTVYVPTELVFTNYGIKKGEWSDIPVLALYPHIQFFNFLSGEKKGNSENYLEYCVQAALQVEGVVITDAWKRNVISNRTEIFERMRMAIDIDPSFFIRNAAEAKWNKRGYFNLCSGKHRVTFLISQGYNFVPLHISQSDYNAWMNRRVLNEFICYIKENRIYKLPFVVSHPMFYYFPSNFNVQLYRIRNRLMEFITEQMKKRDGKIDFNSISILDCIEDRFLIVRILRKAGCKVFKNYQDSELKRRINELLFINDSLDNDKRKYTYIFDESAEKEWKNVLDKYFELDYDYLILLSSSKLYEMKCAVLLSTIYDNDKMKYLYCVRKIK